MTTQSRVQPGRSPCRHSSFTFLQI